MARRNKKSKKDQEIENDLNNSNESKDSKEPKDSSDELSVEVVDDEKFEATEIPYKEPNYFQRIWIELRKINWSSSKNTWKAFFIVLIFVVVAMLVLFAFTLGVLALFDVMGL